VKKLEVTPETIRALRNKLRQTQEQFATHLGVSFNTIRNWEQLRHKPKDLDRRRLEKEMQAGRTE
jgi:DNA-binding transcriptional regulator YiaG